MISETALMFIFIAASAGRTTTTSTHRSHRMLPIYCQLCKHEARPYIRRWHAKCNVYVMAPSHSNTANVSEHRKTSRVNTVLRLLRSTASACHVDILTFACHCMMMRPRSVRMFMHLPYAAAHVVGSALYVNSHLHDMTEFALAG